MLTVKITLLRSIIGKKVCVEKLSLARIMKHRKIYSLCTVPVHLLSFSYVLQDFRCIVSLPLFLCVLPSEFRKYLFSTKPKRLLLAAEKRDRVPSPSPSLSLFPFNPPLFSPRIPPDIAPLP